MSESATPLVSIILPTYNRAQVLPLAVQSVLAQTYENWELVIVNDNSPDNTEEVVASFDDKRIRYSRNNPNLKLPRSLNRGFSLAKGDYLTWTSDDNILASEAIARMVNALQSGEPGLVFADYYEFADTDADGNPLDIKPVRLPGNPDLARGNSIGACFMYPREVYRTIGEYDADLFLNEDYDYWMRIARLFPIQHIPELLYYFRRDEDSLYCSRFSEVRAGSLLARYKNKFLSSDEVISGIADLIMDNLDRHKNTLVRLGYLACKKISYNLTQSYRHKARTSITRKIQTRAKQSLDNYDAGKLTFNDTRMELKAILDKAAVIEYRTYVR